MIGTVVSFFFFFFLQDNKLEECKNCDEHFDIKHESKPITQLVATIKTTSEVRQGYECCYFNSDNLFSKYSKQKKIIYYLHSDI